MYQLFTTDCQHYLSAELLELNMVRLTRSHSIFKNLFSLLKSSTVFTIVINNKKNCKILFKINLKKRLLKNLLKQL